MPLNLLLYTSEFLRQSCYYDTKEPPPGELLMKTSCFIKQLGAGNWNLNFTESGNPYVTDVPLLCGQLQGLTEREVAETENIEDVHLGSEEGLPIDLFTDGEECPDSNPDSEFF
ncbi:hypothetical protein AAFF_G00098070 [Aldrovandia affinis]|uniref:Uncharacterized protein n=1 Tax=Aldrovandia affinis TaxID=143900 RepID=A0AAD7R1C8_9TELE|nr:hypothetical protein AAFF_G00098070 [Aldrovandia affinis]